MRPTIKRVQKMINNRKTGVAIAVTLVAVVGIASAASAAAKDRADAHGAARRQIAAVQSGSRPLTIGRPTVGPIVRRGNTIIAPGGFSAHGYGYGLPGSDVARRADQNADVRARTDGVFGYGIDGLGGTQTFGDAGETGYTNPYWGNSFNQYTGYNGVPTALAFGPAFASRYIADHEPELDDASQASWPSPRDLGYAGGTRHDVDDDE